MTSCCCSREPHKIDGVARHPDRQLRIFVRVPHGVFERLLIDHVQVHMEPALIEIQVEGLHSSINELGI